MQPYICNERLPGFGDGQGVAGPEIKGVQPFICNESPDVRRTVRWTPEIKGVQPFICNGLCSSK